MMKCILFFFTVLFNGTVSAQSGKPVVYYVGNMGVAIVKDDSVILIDALHDYYDVYYLPSDPAILGKLTGKDRPFLKLIVITATHMHNDHFDDALISQMSQTLNQSKVIMGRQPSEKLTGVRQGVLNSIDQVGTVKLSDKLSISLRNVGHSGSRHQSIENYRIEVKWGAYRFVHFGDAIPDAKSFDGLLPGADVAVVPYWFCFDEKDIRLLEAQKFKKIIAAHIDPAGNAPFGKSNVEIIPFKTYGQQYVLE
jgi:L-ascorbate metabolism protein UlaG (beta-lactamase superfamily)